VQIQVALIRALGEIGAAAKKRCRCSSAPSVTHRRKL